MNSHTNFLYSHINLLGFHSWCCILSITPRNYITCFAMSSGTAEGFILGAKKAHFLHMYTHTAPLLSFLSSYGQGTSVFIFNLKYYTFQEMSLLGLMTQFGQPEIPLQFNNGWAQFLFPSHLVWQTLCSNSGTEPLLKNAIHTSSPCYSK